MVGGCQGRKEGFDLISCFLNDKHKGVGLKAGDQRKLMHDPFCQLTQSTLFFMV